MALHPVLLSLVGTIFVLLLWHLVVVFGVVNPLLLPSPLMVAAVFVDAETLQGLLHDALFTVSRAFSGFGLGGVSGVAIGMIVGFFRPIYALLEFLIEFCRSLPAAALLPAFMLFLGIGDASKVALVAFSCSLVMLVQTAAGVKARNATRTMVAQILGATKLQIFRKVILPEILPAVATGLRISISLALIITLVAEMLLSTDRGLGRTILDMQLLFKTPQMYAAIILTGALGYSANKVISIIAEQLIHWEGK